jgi:hypothetical protein
MDSSPSAQNDKALCGNAYRLFDCTSGRQGAADYGIGFRTGMQGKQMKTITF